MEYMNNLVSPTQLITINYVNYVTVIDYINSYIGILPKRYITIHMSYARVRLL